MKDIYGEISYKDKTYKLAFNLNVMESIQEKYGSVNKWAELTDKDEPDFKAIIFGFTEEPRKEDLLRRRLWEKSNLESYLAEMRKESKRRR